MADSGLFDIVVRMPPELTRQALETAFYIGLGFGILTGAILTLLLHSALRQ